MCNKKAANVSLSLLQRQQEKSASVVWLNSCIAQGPITSRATSSTFEDWQVEIMVPWRLRHPQLDTVTLRPAPSDTVTIRPTKVFILRQSDPTGVRQSDHTQTAQFDPLEVGLNVGCDNPTHVQSDSFSASPGRLGESSSDDTQMALLKNGAAPPERTSPTHGSAGRKLDLT